MKKNSKIKCKLCSNNHRLIAYTVKDCPLCKTIQKLDTLKSKNKTLRVKHRELKLKFKKYKKENNNDWIPERSYLR